MCIGIAKSEEVVLTKATLQSCYLNNPDGCGFCYPADDHKSIILKRGYFSFKKFWKDFQEIQRGRPVLIHFRVGTSGGVNEDNCHPFLIDKKHALIHNGNIESKLNEKIDNYSDTRIFVEKVLRPIFSNPTLKKSRFWAGYSFKWLMETTIGSNNKMAIMDSEGFITIYNEKAGEWECENGVWFSNTTYKQDRKVIKKATVEIIVENGVKKELTILANGNKSYRYLGRVQPASLFSLVQTPTVEIKKNDILTAVECEQEKNGKNFKFEVSEIF